MSRKRHMTQRKEVVQSIIGLTSLFLSFGTKIFMIVLLGSIVRKGLQFNAGINIKNDYSLYSNTAIKIAMFHNQRFSKSIFGYFGNSFFFC